ANLLGALEDDQRALVLNAKVLERILGRVEIDLVDHEIRRFLLDVFDDRTLPPAGRTPGGSYIDEDRFAGCLGLPEGLVVEWLRGVAHYRESEQDRYGQRTQSQPEQGMQGTQGQRCPNFGMHGLLVSPDPRRAIMARVTLRSSQGRKRLRST